MPAVGSSISKRRGRLASAIASSTRLTSPYASTLMARSACACMPTLASSASASSMYCERAARQTPRMRRSCESRASWTFSRTVSEANVSAIWNVRPTPWRQMASGLRPTSSTPVSVTEPASGASWPPTMLKHVVLPAPFGPISASISPAPSEKLTPSTARTPPNAFDSRCTASSAFDGAGADAALALTTPRPRG